jgi:hypothetical protein
VRICLIKSPCGKFSKPPLVSFFPKLTCPYMRPALPRISSRLSAFFFWGIKLLPVLKEQEAQLSPIHEKMCNIAERIWPSGQSGGLACRRFRFDPRQGQPLYIWMHMYTLSTMSIHKMDICAILKFFFFFKFQP